MVSPQAPTNLSIVTPILKQVYSVPWWQWGIGHTPPRCWGWGGEPHGAQHGNPNSWEETTAYQQLCEQPTAAEAGKWAWMPANGISRGSHSVVVAAHLPDSLVEAGPWLTLLKWPFLPATPFHCSQNEDGVSQWAGWALPPCSCILYYFLHSVFSSRACLETKDHSPGSESEPAIFPPAAKPPAFPLPVTSL